MNLFNFGILKGQIEKRLGGSIFEEDGSIERYTLDNIKPGMVVTPANTEQVSSVLSSANDFGASVVPWGGGTRIGTGHALKNYSIALNMRRMNEVKEYEPADLTVTAGSGMTLSKLNEILAEHNQFIPLNPPHPEKATIGGTLASNATGFLRDRFGAARDMTLGLRFVRADGAVIKGGGKVAKNVAGYDLTRLIIGSWGTLGIITEVTLRVRPLPELRVTMTAGFSSLSSVVDAAFDLLNAHYTPAFLVVLNRFSAGRLMQSLNLEPGQEQYSLFIGIDGIPDTVNWQVDQIKNTCFRLHADACNVLPENTGNRARDFIRDYPSSEYNGAICKIAATRTGTAKLLEFLQDTGIKNEVKTETLCLPGSGISHILLPFPEDYGDAFKKEVSDLVAKTQSFVDENDGFCTLEQAPLWLKERYRVWQNFPGESIMRKLKKQFDPKNILNPERFIRVLE